MPFKSQAQRAFLYSQHPEIAKRWEKHTPKGTKLPKKVGKMEGPGLAGPTSSGALTGYCTTTPKAMRAKMRLKYATPAGPVTAPSMGLHAKVRGEGEAGRGGIILNHTKGGSPVYGPHGARPASKNTRKPPQAAAHDVPAHGFKGEPLKQVQARRLVFKEPHDRDYRDKLQGKMEQPFAGGFSREEAKRAAAKLGIDFKRSAFTFAAFLEGINHEREHGNVSHAAETIGKIALAHLREDPSYYTKLRQVEHGKFSPMMVRQEGWGAQGDARTPAIPDYAEIYYQPEDDEKRRQESEASLNRRRSMGDGTQKFGFHGLTVPQDEPVLRYVVQKDNLHGAKIGQSKPTIRAPKLVSSKAVLRGKLTARR